VPSDRVENISQVSSRSPASSGLRVTTVPSFNVTVLSSSQKGSLVMK
jgi:hypothetical protein